MAGGGGGGDLEYQPTWVVAIVCTTIIICISLAVERILHYAGKVLKKIVNYNFKKKEVEKIVNYNFKDKALLEMALTHSSYTQAPSYQRLEFLGDAALGLAVAKYSYEAHPDDDQGELTNFRAAIVSTEMLARVAVHHDLFTHLRHRLPSSLELKVKEFARVVSEEGDDIRRGDGVGDAPKVLADVVESILAALYIDSDYDLNKLWDCLRHLLRPLSAKIEHEFQRLEANSNNVSTAEEIDRAKQKLNEFCFKKRWRPPTYSKKVHGPAHERRFICSVNIDTKEGPYAAFGDVKLNLKDAENSAASNMLCHLRTLRSQQRRFLE